MNLDRIHEIGALFIAALLCIFVGLIAMQGKPVPVELGGIAGVAVGYVFRGAIENALIPTIQSMKGQ